MSDEHVDAPPAAPSVAPPRNKGQNLIDSFRAARLAARPALRGDLLANRQNLHRQRLDRLGCGAAEPPRPPNPPDAAQPTSHATVAEPAFRTEAGTSIFAAYCDALETPQAEPQAPAQAAQVQAPAVTELAAAPIPLSAIGFGPGMTIRMSQLGIESAADLAAADAGWLHTALGDLSDLVHAELWIASARKACAAATAAPLPACVEID